MAKKTKGNRVQVILECTEMKDSGMPGTSRYITTKNRKNTPDRLELKKYNPILKKMTIHKEIKALYDAEMKKRHGNYVQLYMQALVDDSSITSGEQIVELIKSELKGSAEK